MEKAQTLSEDLHLMILLKAEALPRVQAAEPLF
jgi:hypothetical protein